MSCHSSNAKWWRVQCLKIREDNYVIFMSPTVLHDEIRFFARECCVFREYTHLFGDKINKQMNDCHLANRLSRLEWYDAHSVTWVSVPLHGHFWKPENSRKFEIINGKIKLQQKWQCWRQNSKATTSVTVFFKQSFLKHRVLHKKEIYQNLISRPSFKPFLDAFSEFWTQLPRKCLDLLQTKTGRESCSCTPTQRWNWWANWNGPRETLIGNMCYLGWPELGTGPN